MVTESKDRRVNTDAKIENDGVKRQPHERDVVADELVQEFARAGHVQRGFLAAARAEIAADGGGAVGAVRGAMDDGVGVQVGIPEKNGQACMLAT